MDTDNDWSQDSGWDNYNVDPLRRPRVHRRHRFRRWLLPVNKLHVQRRELLSTRNGRAWYAGPFRSADPATLLANQRGLK